MDATIAPIKPGKLETWEAWIADLTGPRKAEFEDLNKRYGVTLHAAWLQTTPDGNHLVIIVTDGPGSSELMGKLATSENEFDRWFVARATEVHGLDPGTLAPPASERRL